MLLFLLLGIFNRQILMQKTRRVFEERISKYIVHEKIGSAEKIDRFIVRPNLNDDAGIFAAAYYGKTAKTCTQFLACLPAIYTSTHSISAITIFLRALCQEHASPSIAFKSTLELIITLLL